MLSWKYKFVVQKRGTNSNTNVRIVAYQMLFKDVRPNEESVERRKPQTTWSGGIGETTKGDYSAAAATRGGDH